jgi:hypothetical protein
MARAERKQREQPLQRHEQHPECFYTVYVSLPVHQKRATHLLLTDCKPKGMMLKSIYMLMNGSNTNRPANQLKNEGQA